MLGSIALILSGGRGGGPDPYSGFVVLMAACVVLALMSLAVVSNTPHGAILAIR